MIGKFAVREIHTFLQINLSSSHVLYFKSQLPVLWILWQAKFLGDGNHPSFLRQVVVEGPLIIWYLSGQDNLHTVEPLGSTVQDETELPLISVDRGGHTKAEKKNFLTTFQHWRVHRPISNRFVLINKHLSDKQHECMQCKPEKWKSEGENEKGWIKSTGKVGFMKFCPQRWKMIANDAIKGR